MREEARPKHKPNQKHTLDEVLKSLKDLVGNDVRTKPAPTPKPKAPPRSAAVPPTEDMRDIINSLEALLSGELHDAEVKPRTAPPSLPKTIAAPPLPVRAPIVEKKAAPPEPSPLESAKNILGAFDDMDVEAAPPPATPTAEVSLDSDIATLDGSGEISDSALTFDDEVAVNKAAPTRAQSEYVERTRKHKSAPELELQIQEPVAHIPAAEQQELSLSLDLAPPEQTRATKPEPESIGEPSAESLSFDVEELTAAAEALADELEIVAPPPPGDNATEEFNAEFGQPKLATDEPSDQILEELNAEAFDSNESTGDQSLDQALEELLGTPSASTPTETPDADGLSVDFGETESSAEANDTGIDFGLVESTEAAPETVEAATEESNELSIDFDTIETGAPVPKTEELVYEEPEDLTPPLAEADNFDLSGAGESLEAAATEPESSASDLIELEAPPLTDAPREATPASDALATNHMELAMPADDNSEGTIEFTISDLAPLSEMDSAPAIEVEAAPAPQEIETAPAPAEKKPKLELSLAEGPITASEPKAATPAEPKPAPKAKAPAPAKPEAKAKAAPAATKPEAKVTKAEPPKTPSADTIPVLQDVAVPPPQAALPIPPSADPVREMAVRVIARLNIELRKAGDKPLAVKTVMRLQQILHEAMEKKNTEKQAK